MRYWPWDRSSWWDIDPVVNSWSTNNARQLFFHAQTIQWTHLTVVSCFFALPNLETKASILPQKLSLKNTSVKWAFEKLVDEE